MTLQSSDPRRVGDSSFDAFAATFLESLCWGGLWALLYFQVPRTTSVLADFGVELSQAGHVVISASDLFVRYAYWLLPAGLAVLFLINAFAFGSIRTLWGRVLWTSLMSIIPLLLSGGILVVLQSLISTLQESL